MPHTTRQVVWALPRARVRGAAGPEEAPGRISHLRLRSGAFLWWKNVKNRWTVASSSWKITGWWFEPRKLWVSWDDDSPNIWKNNPNVPNHQPDQVLPRHQPMVNLGDFMPIFCHGKLGGYFSNAGDWTIISGDLPIQYGALFTPFRITTWTCMDWT